MIAIRGYFYDGKTSTQMPAVCRVFDTGAVQVEAAGGGGRLIALSRFDLKASPRVADSARHLYFPDGEKCESGDNRAVDEILARFARTPWTHAVHILETRKRYILFCLAALLAILFVGGRYGLPAAARFIAHQLPQSLVEKVVRQTLSALDGSVLKPTELEPEVQARLAKYFHPLIDAHPDLSLEVHFRKGGRLGANAFALPCGVIIFTDEMVVTAQRDEELLAVLAHETGHVALRHGLQRIIQGSLLSFLLLAVTGDASGTSQLFIGLPVTLTELAYSREFEREADQYALDYLKANGIPPRHFADLMHRLQGQKKREGADADGRLSNYLSTHPSTGERLKRFEE
ncbi:MAG: M48 family metallopeptidase [Desulfobacteraceae bacterium]|nr:MAG: M48 family metallopeptidase [Desulfobacteraceae bacterium]